MPASFTSLAPLPIGTLNRATNWTNASRQQLISVPITTARYANRVAVRNPAQAACSSSVDVTVSARSASVETAPTDSSASMPFTGIRRGLAPA